VQLGTPADERKAQIRDVLVSRWHGLGTSSRNIGPRPTVAVEAGTGPKKVKDEAKGIRNGRADLGREQEPRGRGRGEGTGGRPAGYLEYGALF